MSAGTNFIPGMACNNEGKLLFVLAATQKISGDIVEIGSWQGKSASFLARASQVSGNGKFFAIDHFKGNVGSEDAYILNSIDLSDLENGFIQNLSKLGLENYVESKNMDVISAAHQLKDHKIRFLFIDGDHSYEGVKRDYSLFESQLTDDAIIVFDDFDTARQGAVQAIREIILETRPNIRFQLGKMLVLVM